MPATPLKKLNLRWKKSMSKIAALQLSTLPLSDARLDYYLKACKDSGANLVVLGEYVLNSFFTELCAMSKQFIKEQSESKKASLAEFAKKYELTIIAPYVSVENKGFKKLCLKVLPSEIKSYEQQILMPYAHWNEDKFFCNHSEKLRLFSFSYESLKCALLFGFEAHFDTFWQLILQKKLDLVIMPCANTFESKQRWRELLKMRAFLSSTAILRVNRIGQAKSGSEVWEFYGDSLYVDAFGQIKECLSDKEEMLIIDTPKASEAKKLWGFDKIIKNYEI